MQSRSLLRRATRLAYKALFRIPVVNHPEITMLHALRNAAGTWVAKLLLVLLVASFAVWGISGQIVGGIGGNSVITAGDTSVSVIEYRLAYDRQLNVLSQRLGRRITREQAQALGIDNQVLAQLVAGAVLDEQARAMGLGLSDQRLAALTAEDPAFRGANGRFDRNRFEYVLRQVGMRPEDYFKSRSQVAIRQQIVEAVSDGMNAPDTFLKAVAIYRGEDRTIEFATLPAGVAGETGDPGEGALATWFESRKSNYAAPEYRNIDYIKLEPEDIADPESIADQDVRKDYEDNINRYTTPEKRTVEQLVFATEGEARAAKEKIQGGSTFADIVAAEGKTGTDTSLGIVARSDIADAAVADAAFAIAENEVSDVVAGAFGPVLVHVRLITPEIVQPFGQIKDRIRKEIAENEAARILLDVHDDYEDSRAAGDTLTEAAQKLRLAVRTVDAIDRTGRDPAGEIVDDLPQSSELIRGAFETEPGVENPAINIGSSGFVFYEVVSTTPARDRTLGEVRDRVVKDWKAEELSNLLASKAAETEAMLKDGKTMEEAVANLGLEPRTKFGLKRNGDDADIGQAGIAAVFGVPVNGTGTVRGPRDDNWIVFRVTESFEPAGAGPDAVPEEARNSFASGMADDLLDQMVTRLQEDHGVGVNQSAINRALSF